MFKKNRSLEKFSKTKYSFKLKIRERKLRAVLNLNLNLENNLVPEPAGLLIHNKVNITESRIQVSLFFSQNIYNNNYSQRNMRL